MTCKDLHNYPYMAMRITFASSVWVSNKYLFRLPSPYLPEASGTPVISSFKRKQNRQLPKNTRAATKGLKYTGHIYIYTYIYIYIYIITYMYIYIYTCIYSLHSYTRFYYYNGKPTLEKNNVRGATTLTCVHPPGT